MTSAQTYRRLCGDGSKANQRLDASNAFHIQVRYFLQRQDVCSSKFVVVMQRSPASLLTSLRALHATPVRVS